MCSQSCFCPLRFFSCASERRKGECQAWTLSRVCIVSSGGRLASSPAPVLHLDRRQRDAQQVRHDNHDFA
jgi:hypothetical protein